jgi:hypothetical protein
VLNRGRVMLAGFLPTDEIDYMVENGYWVDNRYESPINTYDEYQFEYECYLSESQAHNEEYYVIEQDEIEARQGPMPRPEYLPEFGSSFDGTIPF